MKATAPATTAYRKRGTSCIPLADATLSLVSNVDPSVFESADVITD